MPTWRCPHCGTPQAESSRCWVCKRSSTSCGTCRHHRRAVAGTLGYCGLDPRRLPLRGDEIRGCWESVPELVEMAPPTQATVTARDHRPRLDFVPLDGGATAPARPATATAVPTQPQPPVSATPPRGPDPLRGFWGDEA